MSLPDLPALATALQAWFDAYPTDPDDAERLTLALESGGERHVVSLQPGQAGWLPDLVEKQIASLRNSHPDENGQCAHCNGPGVMTGARALTAWVAWQLDGPGLDYTHPDEATAKKYAEKQYLDGLDSEDQDDASLEWTGGDNLYELEDNGQDTGWCVSPADDDAQII
ncbi:hypothetical protein ACFYY1_29750 [Streptomyces sp. NPDC001890]|uniref:hypothetical protein n=1 Tax=Streptomyces sp. NPDC001890 TaxID=3364620 RepID=UPI003678E67B